MPAQLKLPVSQSEFLSGYWQQSHLFMPGAVPGFHPPISSNEVAGLAMESDIESRLVEDGMQGLTLFHGPFVEDDYRRSGPWTLLVQSVDQVLDNVAELHNLANFIPCWRIDDIMVSYANDGGSVGPHFDNYDVFLLQGEGQKRWKIGQGCNEHTPLRQDSELRILEQFEQQAEYILNPGDVLYVPPGIAHWGVSQGESTTFSLGFRAPRLNDMLSRRVDLALEVLSSEVMYRDAHRAASTRPGEITPQDLATAVEQVARALAAELGDEAWFGELVTEPRYDIGLDSAQCRQMRALVREGASILEKNGDSKIAWQIVDKGVRVYANGEHCLTDRASIPTLETLCSDRILKADALSGILQTDSGRLLLNFLIDSGSINVQ